MAPTTDPGGFTVLEVLIAMLLLAVGVLGLTGAAAVATRMIGDARRHTQAIALAQSVVERLRSGACPSVGDGEASHGPYRVHWTVSPAAGGTARRALAVVETPGGRPARVDTVSAIVPC